jgi:hypothetical protein
MTVTSERLDLHGQARTATQILDEVLGVSTTMPIWAEEEIERLVKEFTEGSLDESAFRILRERMTQIGLGEFMPQALGSILDRKQ